MRKREGFEKGARSYRAVFEETENQDPQEEMVNRNRTINNNCFKYGY